MYYLMQNCPSLKLVVPTSNSKFNPIEKENPPTILPFAELEKMGAQFATKPNNPSNPDTTITTDDNNKSSKHNPNTNPPGFVARKESEVLTLVFTSGSTSVPKAAIVTDGKWNHSLHLRYAPHDPLVTLACE